MNRSDGFLALVPVSRLPSLVMLLLLTLSLSVWNGKAHARFDRSLGFADAAYEVMAFEPFDWKPYTAQPTGGTLGGLFSRGGLIGGFAAGFIGSGVVGLLFGHGVVGEVTGVAPLLGLTFQLALIVMLAWLIWSWWHDDRAHAVENMSPRQLADAYGHARHEALPEVGDSARRGDEPADDGLGHPK